jgi:hypothetical protein
MDGMASMIGNSVGNIAQIENNLNSDPTKEVKVMEIDT